MKILRSMLVGLVCVLIASPVLKSSSAHADEVFENSVQAKTVKQSKRIRRLARRILRLKEQKKTKAVRHLRKILKKKKEKAQAQAGVMTAASTCEDYWDGYTQTWVRVNCDYDSERDGIGENGPETSDPSETNNTPTNNAGDMDETIGLPDPGYGLQIWLYACYSDYGPYGGSFYGEVGAGYGIDPESLIDGACKLLGIK